jgi:polyhydroxybutyrate depolymerase
VLRRAAFLSAMLVLVAGCGETAHVSSPVTTAAATASHCADRLPLDTYLDGVSGRAPRPLILALHGARQGGFGMRNYTKLSANARGFLVAYPTTPHDNGFWQVQDVPRLLTLVGAIGRCAPVSSLTVVGFSNGGLMANALACAAADRVRAVALVASGYEGLGRCAPSRPVSVLDIHGLGDQVVGYRGLRAFVATWARRDGCAAEPTARHEDDGVTHERWHDCDDGARVEHLRVADDPHGWPTITDANQRIVRFLRAAT